MRRMYIASALATLCFAVPAIANDDGQFIFFRPNPTEEAAEAASSESTSVQQATEEFAAEQIGAEEIADVQEPDAAVTQDENETREAVQTGDGQATITPEVYRYMQQMQYESARDKVNRRAAWKAAQRRMRMASREWYGVSLSRPTANPLPHTATYSAYWAGSYQDPMIWNANGYYPNYRTTIYGY